MLDVLLVIIAIVLGGACIGRLGLSAARGDGLSWRSMVTFQRTYGARSYRAREFWPGGFLPGAAPGSFFGCRDVAVVAALARAAPNRATASLDGWSNGDGLR